MAKSPKKTGRRPSKDEIKAKAARAEARSKGETVEKEELYGPMNPPTVDKGGRPTIYTEELALEVCEHIASGLSLRSIEKIPGMPARKTVLRWALEGREGFDSIYARARQLQLECEADEIVDIADDGRNDWMERESRNGEVFSMVNKEAVDRSKLRVGTRQWRLQRLMQGKYGDKIEQTHKADDAFLAMWQHVSGGPPKK